MKGFWGMILLIVGLLLIPSVATLEPWWVGLLATILITFLIIGGLDLRYRRNK